MNARRSGLPIIVLMDAKTREGRAVNGLHVQTFIQNPFGKCEGTLITFANGDTVTVKEDFDDIVQSFMASVPDG